MRRWWRTVGVLLGKEFRQVSRDRVMPFMISLMPLIQLVVLANAATFEIRSSRLAVVDESGGPTSRALVRRFAASDHFSVERVSRTAPPADGALLAGEVAAVLRLPPDLDRDLVRGRDAGVQLVLSGADGAASGVIANYATAILAREAADRAAGSAAGPAPRPIEIRSRGWFNESLSYEQHMVPGILVVLVTIIGTLLTAMNIVREKEIGTLEQLNATPLRRSEFIAGKLLPFWLIALLELAFGLGIAKLVFDLPIRGSLVLLFGAAGVYLVVALGIGLWISTLAETQQQAMFVTFFFVMVNIFMSGLFTPIASMPGWARAAAEIVPLKHFIEISRGILIRGAGPEAIALPLGILAVMGTAVFALALRRYSKTAA